MKNIYLNKLFQYTATLLLLLVSSTCLFAQNISTAEHHEQTITYISSLNSLTIQDPKIYPTINQGIEETFSIKNRVSVVLNKASIPLTLENTIFKINVTINAYNIDNGTMPINTYNKDLIINYKKETHEETINTAFFEFEGADKIKVKVNLITVAPVLSIIPNIILKGDIWTERSYVFDISPPKIKYLSPVETPGLNRIIDLTPIPNADEYELEWTFYDYESDVLQNPQNYNFSELFRNNATRITTTDTYLYIEGLVYRKGKLFFRYRGVDIDNNDIRNYTKWSSEDITSINSSDYIDFNFSYATNLQAQTSFAENGKYVPTVNFFDGTLRNRQTVVYSESEQLAMFQQNIYDFLGRPSISVLAAPFDNKNPIYYYDFARKSSTEIYTKEELDLDCLDGLPPMHTSEGAANYYSSNNSFLGTHGSLDKFIPEANGYVFATTEYTPDLTGRIQRQGGVGETFQLGSGHETKYYYGKAGANELTRMFGTQVGDNNHYQKNMVQDANGQLSISYVDAHGRTIATSLAGESPDQVNELANLTAPETDIKDLLNNVTNNYDIVSNYTLLVDSESEHTFSYSLDPKSPEFQCLPTDVCYNCAYDLTITISNNCGNVFAENEGEPYIFEQQNFTLGALSTACADTDAGLSTSFLLNLPVGEYKVSKVLSVSQQASNEYLEDFLTQTACLPDRQAIYDDLLEDVILPDCEEDVLEETAPTDCDVMYRLMLADVFPGGLEATYDLTENEELTNVQDGIFSLDNNAIERFRQYFYNDPNDPNFEPEVDYFQDGENPIYVKDLPVLEFIEYFNDVWAERIVDAGGHSASGCYQDCIANLDVLEYHQSLLEITTYQEAVDAGLINENTCLPQILNQDPGMSGGEGSICEDGEAIFGYGPSIVWPYPEENGGFLRIKWDPDGDGGFIDYTPSFDTYEELAAWMTTWDPYGNIWSIATGVSCTGFPEDRTYLEVSNYDMAIHNYGRLQVFYECPSDSDALECFVDSRIACLYRTCTNSDYEEMIDFIHNVNTYSCVSTSLIDIITQEVYCNGETPCFTSFGKGDCDEDNDLAWILYRNIYLGQLNALNADNFCNLTNFMENYVNSNEEYSDKDPIFYNDTEFELFPEGDVVHDESGNSSDTDFNLVEQAAYAEGQLQAECSSICTAQAEQWMAQLVPCGLTADNETLYNNIRDRLITVCTLGCDFEHPTGASTINPALTNTAYGDASFEEILNDSELSEMISSCSIDCNPKMIQFPAAYEIGTYMGGPAIFNISHLDRDEDGEDENCLCEKITEMEVAFNAYEAEYPGEFESLGAFLAQFSSLDISDEDLDVLKLYCDLPENMPCNTLPEAIIIPPYLECDVCKTCAEVNTALADFSSCSNLDEDSNLELQALHLNAKLGYTLTADDYFYFLEDCANNPILASAGHIFICPSSVFGFQPLGPQTTCEEELLAQLETDADLIYIEELEQLKEDFVAGYLNECVEVNNETFSSEGAFSQYHFTLYYYDQAGNLVQTIPPRGVDLGNQNHLDKTQYTYNSFNQVVEQDSPDTESTRFWYDRVGRVIASQDGRQRNIDVAKEAYSYTKYDALGRITEVGEVVFNIHSVHQPMNDIIARSSCNDCEECTIENYNDNTVTVTDFCSWLHQLGSSRQFITRTYYDNVKFEDLDYSADNGPVFEQENLRNRVVSVTIEADDNDFNENTYDYATHYSYDVSGNVKTLVQEMSNLHAAKHGFKRIDYEYDYISGNVHAVFYQKGQEDQFTHRYFYDANNRLTDVKTSAVETEYYTSQSWDLWDNDANYDYYKHGPLARTVLGEQQVQGCDYAYNLQGWIKGMNSSINAALEIGEDGFTSTYSYSSNKSLARDAISYTLGYFDGDYEPIGGSGFELNYSNSDFNTGYNAFEGTGKSLYNGNIRNMVYDNAKLPASAYAYQYDQLHRIKSTKQRTLSGEEQDNSILNASLDESRTRNLGNYTYDPNGNIINLNRTARDPNNSAEVITMDALSYDYVPFTNKLEKISDTGVDIAGNADLNGTIEYEYDGTGNLERETHKNIGGFISEINKIEWTPYGKVHVVRDEQNNDAIRTAFDYAPDQNRVRKSNGAGSDTYYVRDAQGNVMAVYHHDGTNVTWKEQHLYGSSRLGIQKMEIPLNSTPSAPYYSTSGYVTEGNKRYELSNHLGNVLATINDRKKKVDADLDGVFAVSTSDYYEPTILTANDYYPFGLTNQDRSYTLAGESHRFGFNGKEKDDSGEWGSQTHYDYGFRIYNPAIAKFLSVDPLTKSYPYYSPYHYAGNSPIKFVDLDGLETYDLPIDYGYGGTRLPTAPELVTEVVVGAWDGAMNLGLMYYGSNWATSESIAKWTKGKLKSAGYSVPPDITNNQILDNFKLRSRGGGFVVEPRGGALSEVVDFGASVLSLAALSPAKNGSAFLARIPTASGISAVLRSLRQKRIAGFIDPDTSRPLRPFEVEGGAIFEEAINGSLKNSTTRGIDFFVENGSFGGRNLAGKSVSHFGVPKAGLDASGKPLNNFNDSIDSHLRTDPADIYVIDVKDFSQEATNKAKQHIDDNYSHLKDKIIYLEKGNTP